LAAEDIPIHVTVVQPPMDSAQSVRSHSAELKKELGLGDLVLTPIRYAVGSHGVGTPARLGDSQVAFYPTGCDVLLCAFGGRDHLNRIPPLEGGLYQWTKSGWNDFAGFQVGWNLWLYSIVFMSSQGMSIATNVAYAFGVDSLGADKWFIMLVTGTRVAFLIGVTRASEWANASRMRRPGPNCHLRHADLDSVPQLAKGSPAHLPSPGDGRAGSLVVQPEYLRQAVVWSPQRIRVRLRFWRANARNPRVASADRF
jgi:hypothetical protein